MTHDVFICHSSKDRTIANAIVATLEQHGIRCWIAPRDVVPGVEYAGAIVEAITASKLTVLVFSSNSNESQHVRREIERTVSHGRAVLPFRVEDVVPSPSLEYFISGAHWLDAMTPPLEQHLDHLVGTIKLLLEREAGGAVPAGAGAEGTPPLGGAAPLPAAPQSRPAWQWAGLGIAGVVAVVAAGLILVPGLLGPRGAAVSPPPTTGATEAAVATPTIAPTARSTSAASVTPTDNPGDDFYDEFNGTIAADWTWLNEDRAGWNLTDNFGWLTIDSPASPPLANLLVYQPAAPTYALTTMLEFAPTSEYQFAGVVLTGRDPDADRLQFGWGFCEGEGCVGAGLYFNRIEGGVVVGNTHATLLTGSPSQIYLALDVTSNVVTALYSYDGGDDWFDGGIQPLDPAYTRVGLVVLDAADEISADFGYVYVARYLE